ncbi:hypothetical protein CRYUN_Cryun21dG0042900 [Craigia yunnanensis]
MRKRMDKLRQDFDPSTTASIFSTKNQVLVFSFVVLAEKAFDDDGNLKQSKELSINKVGHALLDIDQVFKEFSCSEKVLSLLFSLGYKRPAVIQSMYIFKQPGIGEGLVRRFIRGEDGVNFDRPSPSYDQGDFVPIEVKAGSLVVIHGDLIHQSVENQSPNSRHAYSLHVVDTDGCKWAEDKWIKRKVEPEPLYAS